jgi:hypothetical protein
MYCCNVNPFACYFRIVASTKRRSTGSEILFVVNMIPWITAKEGKNRLQIEENRRCLEDC